MPDKPRKLLGPHPWRRTTAVSVLLVTSLLLGNAVSVDRQEAAATAHTTVPVDGHEIHVAQDGDREAPALVLVHGLAGSHRWWDRVVPALAKNYRVIRIDMLGHGQSAKPREADYGIKAQGRRTGEVLDELGVTQAVAVGHSTGGSIVTALAEQRHDLVTGLALIDTGPNVDAYISQGIAGQLMATPVLGHLLWRVRTDAMLRRAMDDAVSRDIELPEAFVDDVRGMTYHAFTATLQASDDYLQECAVPERLAPLGKPLLVVFGDKDRRWKPSSAEDYRPVADADIELIPDVGHSPMLEDSDRTSKLLLEFAGIHQPGGAHSDD